MQLTQSRKLRQNTKLKIPKILAQRDKAAKYKEEEEEDLKNGNILKLKVILCLVLSFSSPVSEVQSNGLVD